MFLAALKFFCGYNSSVQAETDRFFRAGAHNVSALIRDGGFSGYETLLRKIVKILWGNPTVISLYDLFVPSFFLL